MTIMVKLSHPPLELAFEVGSFNEAVGVLEAEKGTILRAFSLVDGGETALPVAAGTTETTATEQPGKRGRKPKNQPDPATASAPPPAPIPTAAPAVPDQSIPGDLSIPAFLQRPAAPAPAVAAPPAPPPPIPTAPPVVPAAPSFVLGNKVADDLQKRKDASLDSGKSLHDWLMPNAPFLIAGATLDEAIAVLRLTSDDKVEAIAKALQLA
jgi:hypothetical protein